MNILVPCAVFLDRDSAMSTLGYPIANELVVRCLSAACALRILTHFQALSLAWLTY